MGFKLAVRGFFDGLKKKDTNSNVQAQMLNDMSPIFALYGENIYTSDIVRSVISRIANEMSKLNPMHVRHIYQDNISRTVPVGGALQKLLNNPNPLMTKSDFIGKVVWLLHFNYNAFIYPMYEWTGNKDGTVSKRFTALYPLKPYSVEFIEDASSTLFVKMQFANNFTTTIKYEDLIHVRLDYSDNEFMGGNRYGEPEHTGLKQTLAMNDDLLHSIAKSMKINYAINGIIKSGSQLDIDKQIAMVREFEQKLRNNESGFLPTDSKAEFVSFARKSDIIDEATLKFIDSKILRYFTTPLPILMGDYTKAQHEAWYQAKLEPMVIAFGQALTKAFFTPTERSFGNEIVLYAKKLIFMNNQEQIDTFTLLTNIGGVRINEIRDALGYEPFTDEEGGNRIPYSKNFSPDTTSDKNASENNSENSNNGGG